MKKNFTFFLLTFFTLFFSQNYWKKTSMQGTQIKKNVSISNYYSLDLNELKQQLSFAVEQSKNAKPVEISIPTDEGNIERFAVYSRPVVVKSLADKYQLGSYVGIGIDDPEKLLRFSVSPNDFQSMIIKNGIFEFIEPQNKEKTVYGVHLKTSGGKRGFNCSVNESTISRQQINKLFDPGKNKFQKFIAFDKKYRTLRLALSVTGEYTTYFGGVAGALAQMNATMTRVNGVYEKELTLQLILQDLPQIIYTNPTTDPYSSSSFGAGGIWNNELAKTLKTVVGNANFDIGHLFGDSGGGGNAGCIGCVCSNFANFYKGSGFTSPNDGNPSGDDFDIDYVTHEMGHQLGANHTFSMDLENTGVNVEPGSGSTIMGYAGITGNTDLQAHSDPFFHNVSIIQIEDNLASDDVTCDIETSISNNPPVITPMSNYTIPKSTAFVLTAEATDAENDPLTYCWEEIDDASNPVTSVTGNNDTGALFRSYIPSLSPTRYFPKFSSVLAGNLTIPEDWETVAKIPRETNFRVTVRDNASTLEQQVAYSSQKITVGSAGPFKVTSARAYNDKSSSPINWDVVSTNAAPYNVSHVKIDYTTDNGATWVVLAESTPNDGTENFSFATIATGTIIKLRVSAIGNVFYTIAPITVTTTPISAPNCATLSSPTNNATGIAYLSSTLKWTAPVGVYVDSYDVYLDQNPDPTTLITNTTATSYDLTNLIPSTKYYWKVVPKNITGAATGCSVFNFTTTELTYCTAGAIEESFEKISNVTFSNINNSSTEYVGYEDFTSVIGNVTLGSQYNFTTTTNSTTFPTDQVLVWIDFNQDKDFDDAGELVFVSALQKSPWTGIITIPTTALLGSTRMRVRLHDTRLNQNNTPCGNSSYGQVEDYTLNLSTLSVDNATNNALQVYPNPADHFITISKLSGKTKYSIYSIDGKLVSQGNITENNIDISQLEKGVYIIAIENSGKILQAKFIKK